VALLNRALCGSLQCRFVLVTPMSKTVKLIEPGELDEYADKWVAIINGRVVCDAKSLSELIVKMKEKGYELNKYYVLKVPSHELILV